MKEEYDALMKNGTWSLVPRASNTNVVDGIDFHETFSPVVKSTTIRAVLSLAVTNDWPLRQLDIQNAFLHGNLKEQAPHAWFERLSKALFDIGFKGSKTDPFLFIFSRGDTLLHILVYVDDIIVTVNNKGTIDNIICQLGSAFALKDLGPLNCFLGIEIVLHVSGILLSKKNKISTSSGFFTICYPISAELTQYMHAPTENHWSAVKHILRYLHGTVEHGMLVRRSSGSTLQAFTDMLWKEAEYKALADTVAELTWLQALLNELGIRSSSTPILFVGTERTKACWICTRALKITSCSWRSGDDLTICLSENSVSPQSSQQQEDELNVSPNGQLDIHYTS
nr:hypothetical protein [Tanacetum cinerariifolium]